jgi:hypothetical protein
MPQSMEECVFITEVPVLVREIRLFMGNFTANFTTEVSSGREVRNKLLLIIVRWRRGF